MRKDDWQVEIGLYHCRTDDLASWYTIYIGLIDCDRTGFRCCRICSGINIIISDNQSTWGKYIFPPACSTSAILQSAPPAGCRTTIILIPGQDCIEPKTPFKIRSRAALICRKSINHFLQMGCHCRVLDCSKLHKVSKGNLKCILGVLGAVIILFEYY